MSEPQVDWIGAAAATAARQRRDRGVRRAGQKAEDKSAGWHDKAIKHLKTFVAQRRGAPFLTENFVKWAKFKVMPPPDGRAWGCVMQRACREGIVVKDGYGIAETSNQSPKVLWKGSSLSQSGRA